MNLSLRDAICFLEGWYEQTVAFCLPLQDFAQRISLAGSRDPCRTGVWHVVSDRFGPTRITPDPEEDRAMPTLADLRKQTAAEPFTTSRVSNPEVLVSDIRNQM